MEVQQEVQQELKEFVCDVCHKQFKKKYNLQVHQRLHTDERPYMCKFCKCTFRQLTHLKNHILNVHQRKKSDSSSKRTKNYLCLRCTRRYSSLWRVISHTYTSHKNPTIPIFCIFCQKNFVLNSEELLKHCRLDHKKEVEQINCIQDHVTWQNKNLTPYFDCNICKEQLPTFQYTIQHLVEEHQLDPSGIEERNLQCLYECGRYFGNELSLVSHFVNEHWLPGCTNCIMCEKPFHSPNAAKKHFRTFHCLPLRERLQSMGVNLDEIPWEGNKEKSLNCPYCGIGCINTSALEVHVRKHKQEKPFPCPSCEKAFTQSGNLNKHLKIVHEGWPRKKMVKSCLCPECDVSITTPSAMDRHLRSHNGEKPFKCEKCGAALSQKGNLTAHSKTCTGINKTKATFSLNNGVQVDTSQDIELLHFNLNPIKSSLLSPTNNNQQDGSSGTVFSRFRIEPALPSHSVGEEYDTTGGEIQIDTGRLDYMNLEYLTEQYLSAAVGNVTEPYNANQQIPVDHSQSVITKHFPVASSHMDDASIVKHEINDCTSLTSIQDQSYLDRMNMGAFNVEDLFQDHTIDERFLNDCTSHIQDEMTPANDLLMVPVSCWWPAPPPSKLNNNMNMINNNTASASTKTFSQTVIKNVSGGEVKDVSTLGV